MNFGCYPANPLILKILIQTMYSAVIPLIL